MNDIRCRDRIQAVPPTMWGRVSSTMRGRDPGQLRLYTRGDARPARIPLPAIDETGTSEWRSILFPIALCILLLSMLPGGCDLAPTSSSQQQAHSSRSFMGPANQPVTYSTDPRDVIIRTFYGGGPTGALSLGPQISIYGDGTYILGLDQQGKLSADALQSLLNALVNTYGLLNFTQQKFTDVQDQDMTFLELSLNRKQEELAYGSFGHYQAGAQDLDEYQRLGKALTTIVDTIQGPTQPYRATNYALLVRQIFNPNDTQSIPSWPLNEFTAAQAATYECGLVPADDTSQNGETACNKFVIPDHAILLNTGQVQALRSVLHGLSGTVTEQGLSYTVTLRPLLPDELSSKTLAMFGGNQSGYRGVPLFEQGSLPPVPTATPPT